MTRKETQPAKTPEHQAGESRVLNDTVDQLARVLGLEDNLPLAHFLYQLNIDVADMIRHHVTYPRLKPRACPARFDSLALTNGMSHTEANHHAV